MPDGRPLGVRHGVNTEAGVKAAWFNGAVNGMLAAYDIRQYRIPLSLSSAGFPGRFARGTSRSRGVDLELTGKIGGWLFGSGYTLNNNRAATALWNGVRGPIRVVTENSPETPNHLLKAWANTKLSGPLAGWTVGGNLRAQTSQIVPLLACSNLNRRGCENGRSIAKPYNRYAIFDLRAEFQFNKNWSLGATVNNVLDKQYYESSGNVQTGFWRGEPRNFLLNVEGAFGTRR
jgi:outer membrane receptor for ferric coprogen and ferric-rhodotorulic acid